MIQDLYLQSYDYTLPQERIATYPASPRESAKLLVYDRKKDLITHSDFFHFYDFLPKDYLVILNDTKVIKARMYGNKLKEDKSLGGRVEVLYHRHLSDERFLVQIRGKVKPHTLIILDEDFSLEVVALLENGFREVRFFTQGKIATLSEVLEKFEKIGHIPLPPYIKREDERLDESEYQSVFAKNLGAVAAPTASLHFSDISYLKSHYSHCFVTLHVGAGTFLSVESEEITEHKIHTESFEVSKEAWEKIASAKHTLCIGTTSARVVEYLYQNPPKFEGEIYQGECDLFLHPLNPPKKLDSLLTNFHLPKSTLIMLVSSLVGREKCLELYSEAIKHNYRFYSYGDGMLIL
ncbi:tRNA preQ1(34) S-adenosylmethionine ribosyltransferase-isomerase QueA [Helicobacter brantae]|uniref:tRNA preQ1(34) S-adenosylmethionine ribosyltransferase-isomerase QueA n=1 Tax=Helicobacter brantae TaxID=375927 RepID=UPI001FE6B8DF|nr:tRNA preQ1(34) S-adenosylmethionine ribosyltransferase-isomerase QueA [Helicobacter brantae]